MTTRFITAVLAFTMLAGTAAYAANSAPPGDPEQLAKWCRNRIYDKYSQRGADGVRHLPREMVARLVTQCISSKGQTY